MKNFSIITALILVLTAVSAQGQFRNDRSFFYDYGIDFFAEAHSLPTASPDSVNLTVFFRMSYSLLTFSFVTEPGLYNKKYLSQSRVNIDFKDGSGIIRAREEFRKDLYVDVFDATQSKTDYLYGSVATVLPKADYTLLLELSNQDNKLLRKYRIDELKEWGLLAGQTFSKPIMVYENDEFSPTRYHPFILDGNIAFTSKNAAILILGYKVNPNASYSFKISSQTPENVIQDWGEMPDIYGQPEILVNKQIKPDYDLFGRPFLTLLSESNEQKATDVSKNNVPENTDLNYSILKIDIPNSTLVPGSYELQLSNSAAVDTLKHSFNVDWIDIPLSMRNPSYALEIMYYLLPDDVYSDFRSLAKTEIMREVINWWKKRDPTPSTPFNEAMTTYFTRADYAFFNFQTIEEKDGAKTDRGKIYILKGEPEKIDTEIGDEKTTETWHYPNLNEKYIFRTDARGVFVLREIQPLEE